MRSPTSRTRHRLQFAAAILGTVGAVYGFSRLVKPHHCPTKITTPPQVITYVPAPPIVPRVDPPIAHAPLPPKVSPAFMSAVSEGDIAAMEKMYTPGMALDGTLHAAAATGNKTTVTWLLDHGADVHENEEDTEAPVLAADNHPAIVKLLFERGAKETNLSMASMVGAVNAVNRLLAKHTPVDDGSPLFFAVTSAAAAPKNRQIIVDKLLAAGADANDTGDGSVPLVQSAILSCEVPDDDDDDNANDKGKKPAAPANAKPACVALIQSLTSHGARIAGETLTSALEVADPIRGPVLDAVLAGRLEPSATAVALSSATGERDAAVVRKLSAKGVAWAWHDGEADASAPLIEAIERLDSVLVRAMLDAGAPADLHLKDGRSPLGLALDKVSTDSGESARIIELLVAHGAQVNRRLPDGRSPLFAAAEAGDIRVVNALLDHGARVNELILDETALDAAERSGNVPVARILHARGGRRAPSQDKQ